MLAEGICVVHLSCRPFQISKESLFCLYQLILAFTKLSHFCFLRKPQYIFCENSPIFCLVYIVHFLQTKPAGFIFRKSCGFITVKSIDIYHPLTLPAATPPTMLLERNRYTTITGRMDTEIIMYTTPISNFKKSALRS